MDRELTKQEIDALERLIDTTDMGAVLRAIAQICHEKAEHVRTNWQDDDTANHWSRLGSKIERIA